MGTRRVTTALLLAAGCMALTGCAINVGGTTHGDAERLDEMEDRIELMEERLGIEYDEMGIDR